MNGAPKGQGSNALTPEIFCKACASSLVQVGDWSQEDASNWRIRIWCPECGFERLAILGSSDVEYLSYAIEGGFARVLEALGELQDMPLTDAWGETALALDLVTRLKLERKTPTTR
ncbi:MAG: hypothetical protein M1274_12190 [Actinobacteria bacterium]|nr:hypothetical protein [Actinomycetota bacterium]